MKINNITRKEILKQKTIVIYIKMKIKYHYSQKNILINDEKMKNKTRKKK